MRLLKQTPFLMFFSAVLTAAFFVTFSPAFSSDPPQSRLPLLEDSQKRFAFSLHQHLSPSGNLIHSPAGLHELLAQLSMGARGKTLFEMEKTMELGGLSGELSAAYQELRVQGRSRTPSEKSYRNLSANSLWLQRGFPLLPTFTGPLSQIFGTTMRSLDFVKEPKKALEEINQWTKTQTEGKIPQLFRKENINRGSKLILVNAAYFSANWQTAFTKNLTKPGTFHLSNGKKLRTQMMARTEQFQFLDQADCEVVILPYKGGDAQMLVVVPKAGHFRQVEKTLTPERIKEWRTKMEFQNLTLKFPKFSFSSHHSLSQSLKQMGIQQAFSGDADFSGMTLEKGLTLGEVFQKAIFRVDENGTEAAAASAATLYLTAGPDSSKPKLLEINRPFLFLIEDTAHGTPLFMGRVTSPS